MDHFHAAEVLMADADEAGSITPEGLALIALAQVHATLALVVAQSARHVDTPPGPCPIDSIEGLICVWSAGHLGLHSRRDVTWTRGVDRFERDAAEHPAACTCAWCVSPPEQAAEVAEVLGSAQTFPLEDGVPW